MTWGLPNLSAVQLQHDRFVTTRQAFSQAKKKGQWDIPPLPCKLRRGPLPATTIKESHPAPRARL